MTTISDTGPVHPVRRTRPFYWSVRRELWEHRAVYIAPLVVAGIVLFGFAIRLAHLPQLIVKAEALQGWKQDLALTLPFAIASGAVLVAGWVVAVFYCLGALNNERRDRSILFWKSLPVSDLMAVLSKACVPLVILPATVLVIALALQWIMLGAGTGVLLASGHDGAVLGRHWPVIQMSLVVAYTVVIGTLWYAPLYGWLLLVSAWARRLTFLWAVLVPIGLAVVERIAFDTSYVGALVQSRLSGFVLEGFSSPPRGTHAVPSLALLAPARFFSSPGLWLGLVVAAAFLAAAVWLRRDREPI